MINQNGNDKTKPSGSVKEEKQQQPQGEESDQSTESMYKKLQERHLRLAAEFDNYKKRTKLDLDGAKSKGAAELAKALLLVLDEFELALIVASNSSDKSIAKGVELLYSNFADALMKAGLKQVPTEGMVDPYKHEVVMVKESDKKPGTILETVKKGYMFDDMLLRPAAVIVAKDAKPEK